KGRRCGDSWGVRGERFPPDVPGRFPGSSVAVVVDGRPLFCRPAQGTETANTGWTGPRGRPGALSVKLPRPGRICFRPDATWRFLPGRARDWAGRQGPV